MDGEKIRKRIMDELDSENYGTDLFKHMEKIAALSPFFQLDYWHKKLVFAIEMNQIPNADLIADKILSIQGY